MRELLLIDLVICAAVIVVAAAVMLLLRRSSGRSRIPVQEQPGSVAELADQGMSGREVADVPVSGHDIAKQDPGTGMPAGPEQAAESEVSGLAATDLGPDGLGAELNEPPAAAGAATFSERVRGYYQEADRPVAGYLAARGWTEQQGTPGQVADAAAASVSREAAAGPGTARRRLAA
jgi:hypothetical protein